MLGDLSGDGKRRQSYSPRRCHGGANRQQGEGHAIEHFWDQRRTWRSLAACKRTVVRRAKSVPSLEDGFGFALRRVRGSNVDEHENVSFAGVREAKITESTTNYTPGTVDPGVHARALRVIGELIDIKRQPSNTSAPGSVPLVARPRGGALRNTYHASDANTTDFHHGSNSLDEICERRTGIRYTQRHCAAFTQACHQPRTPRAGDIPDILKANGSTGGPDVANANDSNMPLHFQATAVADGQCLDPDTAFDPTMPDNGTKTMKDSTQFSVPLLMRTDSCKNHLITLDVVEADGHVEDGLQSPDSPPEMDSGYDTSESGLSVAEELAAQYLTPLQSMLELLPADENGRFGSYYSPTRAKGPGFYAWLEKNRAIYPIANTRESRFSSSSSIYSEHDLDPEGAWPEPIQPLAIRKDHVDPIPPIPEKNPLRMRLSKTEPRGYGEQQRGSRNILNLHLDLSKTKSRDVQNAARSPRKSSRAVPKRDAPKPLHKRPHLSLVIPGQNHISQTRRIPVEKSERQRACTSSREHTASQRTTGPVRECRPSTASHTQSRHRSTRDSPRSSHSNTPAVTKAHGRSHSARDNPEPSEKTKLPRNARGHGRGTSDPLRVGGVSDMVSKWNATKPASATVRKTCIPSLLNDGYYKRRPPPTPAINKRLPPLPLELRLEVAVRES